MKEEKKESPIGVLWGWGKPYHGKFIGSIILAVLGVACQMVPYFCVAPFAGYLVDHLPRRRLGMAASLGLVATAAILCAVALGALPFHGVWPIYLAIALTGWLYLRFGRRLG